MVRDSYPLSHKNGLLLQCIDICLVNIHCYYKRDIAWYINAAASSLLLSSRACNFSLQHNLGEKKCLFWKMPSGKRWSWWEATLLYPFSSTTCCVSREQAVVKTSWSIMLPPLERRCCQLGGTRESGWKKNLFPDAGWFSSCLGNSLLCPSWKTVIFIISCPRSVKKRVITVLSLTWLAAVQFSRP